MIAYVKLVITMINIKMENALVATFNSVSLLGL